MTKIITLTTTDFPDETTMPRLGYDYKAVNCGTAVVSVGAPPSVDVNVVASVQVHTIGAPLNPLAAASGPTEMSPLPPSGAIPAFASAWVAMPRGCVTATLSGLSCRLQARGPS